MRLGLVTSRNARPMLEDVIKGYDNVTVIELPVHAIGHFATKVVAKVIEARRDILEKARSVDVILVPGTLRGSTDIIEEVVGRPVYKATKSIAGLPIVIEYIRKGYKLDKTRPAEEVLGSIKPEFTYEKAFSIGNVDIPYRGPPIVLFAEVNPSVSQSDFDATVERHVAEGAQVIIVGVGGETPPREAGKRVEKALAYTSAVVSEAPTPVHADEALSAGAKGISVGVDSLEWALDRVGSGHVILLGDRDVDKLAWAVNRAKELGIHVIADPVVGLPGIDLLESMTRLIHASKTIKAPLLFTAANVTEEIEADSHGVHAVLAMLAVEASASGYLVVEEEYRSIHGVAEAREALRLAMLSRSLLQTPRGLYSRLLVVKQSVRPRKPRRPLEARLVGYVEPRMDKRGYIEVYVDHEKSVVGAAYRELGTGRVIAAFEGRHGNSVARSLIRAVGLDPEHAAYLGAELAKAEIALKLGRSYIQDEDVIKPVWLDDDYEEGSGERSC
ncbi:MAG: dihydropteroate synthase-like protein [Desulfurococcales archaeon]|nr:dihydropteroate synthase-like protein [Desulfurococcales archaeon]